ncbi:MAG: glycine zipper 2TM domain-containing protein [Gammaproteobacteria bacterium]|nr:MAG: glycine zipper 2TM domain-containing protein [Gammaproteobacteria bacterium]
MKRVITTSFATILIALSLVACTNRDMATVGGAAAGGVVGNAITGGSTLGTVAGAVGGGLLGRAAVN